VPSLRISQTTMHYKASCWEKEEKTVNKTAFTSQRQTVLEISQNMLWLWQLY